MSGNLHTELHHCTRNLKARSSGHKTYRRIHGNLNIPIGIASWSLHTHDTNMPYVYLWKTWGQNLEHAISDSGTRSRNLPKTMRNSSPACANQCDLLVGCNDSASVYRAYWKCHIPVCANLGPAHALNWATKSTRNHSEMKWSLGQRAHHYVCNSVEHGRW